MSLITNDTSVQSGQFPFAYDRSASVIENVEFRHANGHSIDNNRDMLKTVYANRVNSKEDLGIAIKDSKDNHCESIKERASARLDSTKERDVLSKEMAFGFAEARITDLKDKLEVSRDAARDFKSQATLDAILKAVSK